MGIAIFVNDEILLYKDIYHIHFYASGILYLEFFLVFFIHVFL